MSNVLTEILAAKADQQVVRSELANGVLESEERIISSDASVRLGAHLLQLPENGP